MTQTQVADNLMFVAALQQLMRLFTAGSMTEQEYAQVKKELERRLRPTILTEQ